MPRKNDPKYQHIVELATACAAAVDLPDVEPFDGLLMTAAETIAAAGFAESFQLTGSYADDILIMAKAQLAGVAKQLPLLQVYFQQQIEQGMIRGDLSSQTLTHAFTNLFGAYGFFEAAFYIVIQTPSEEELRSLVDIFVLGTIRA